ncbi:MAG TPA: transcriptional repressor [Desulfomonilia bacterium]|jgi:Fe2+ or Zn2+ uptake regulation protein
MNKNSQRITKQKLMIVDELRKVKTHPTAQDVYAMVRRLLPNISLGTVYRNLEMLSDKGDIQRLAFHSGKRRYDGNPNNHPHICCKVCGKVDDLPENMDINEKIIHSITEVCGYEITDYSIELFGICADCRKEKINSK